MLTHLAFAIARRAAAGPALGVLVQYAPALIPGRRAFEDAGVLAIQHPKPGYPKHMLILPKRRAPTFVALAQHGGAWTTPLRLAVVAIAESQGIDAALAVLCVNGGRRQDVAQVHFHLFEGRPPAGMGVDLAACLVAIGALPDGCGYTAFVINAFDADVHLRFVLDADNSPR